jgi:[acyl-carrier-protein] S-malonyltransferase
MKAAMIFPGQGSQYVGMGKDLAEAFPKVKALYEEADDILKYPFSRLCFQGNPEVLTETRNAQPAILLHSIAVTRILREEGGVEPAIVAGHSLGEYSALAAAGVIGVVDALMIVRKRGELMYEAGLSQPGTMAAVIGMDREDVASICAEASNDDSVAVIANINSPGQIVISGHIDAVERAMELAGAQGAKKAVKLNVSGAFHSPLVAPAQNELIEYIAKFPFDDTGVGVICNADAAILRRKAEIIDALSRQLTSPVLWSDSMRVMIEKWDGMVIEAGPGKVLSGLMKRIDRSRPVTAAGTAAEVEAIVAPEVEPA